MYSSFRSPREKERDPRRDPRSPYFKLGCRHPDARAFFLRRTIPENSCPLPHVTAASIGKQRALGTRTGPPYVRSPIRRTLTRACLFPDSPQGTRLLVPRANPPVPFSTPESLPRPSVASSSSSSHAVGLVEPHENTALLAPVRPRAAVELAALVWSLCAGSHQQRPRIVSHARFVDPNKQLELCGRLVVLHFGTCTTALWRAKKNKPRTRRWTFFVAASVEQVHTHAAERKGFEYVCTDFSGDNHQAFVAAGV